MYVIGKEEIDAVARVIESKKLSRYALGKSVLGECDLFEAELSQYYEKEHSLFVTSGTNALIAALVGLQIGPGDEVIIPAYTYIATPGAVLAVGAIPIIAEIDSSLTLDPNDVRKKISSKTKAIIPVHMNGLPCQMDAICSVANEYGIPVVEDVAQAMGGSFRGKPLGTFGEVGCFSFNHYKILTCGEGGAFITNNKLLYERAFIHHDMGMNFTEYMSELESPIFIGASMRTSEISAAIMRVQLKRLGSIISNLRMQKKTIEQIVLDGAAHVEKPISNCVDGDCGSSLMLTFSSPEKCRTAEAAIKKSYVPALTLVDFFRHNYRSWTPISEGRVSHRADFGAKFDSQFFRNNLCKNSDQLLARSLIIFLDGNLSQEQATAFAHRVRDAIRSTL